MALQISTDIIINSSPAKVWGILVDNQNYPKWNPFIKSIVGEFKVGNKIKVVIHPPKSNAMTFKPKVLTLIENRELSWLGHLLFPGIFDGKHKFELIDNGNGTTTFKQSEVFKGILVPLFKKQLNENTRNGFIAMNKAIKELAEG